MSKIVYICEREPQKDILLNKKLEVISKRIIPDNISANDPLIINDKGITYALINPVSTIDTFGPCVLMGVATAPTEEWWKPGSEFPEGSFALFRADESTVELVTDVVASRTIWYYHDEELFISSTSQRAILMLIQNLSFNSEALPWILSTGSLGPGNSWDKRLKMLQADSIVSLSRQSWEIKTHSNPVNFSTEEVPDAEHQKKLKKSLEETFLFLKLDFNKWVLPLSGGFDSRSILCFFNSIGYNISNLRTITWGLKKSLNERGNDAYIAKQVASDFNIQNEYLATDLSEESFETIINRFLVCGEGRIDHFGGYTDGFNVWKTLFENNVQGIIRGDESLGWVPVESALQVRSCVGLPLCSDFSNLKNYKEYGLPTQLMPDHLEQRVDETLEKWRDRLYQQYRIPIILAALNDLKLPYVEIINPLLSKKIIYCGRSLPDRLRENKRLFKKIVNEISPKINYATKSATAHMANVFKSPKVVNLFKERITSEEATKLFSADFLMDLVSNLNKGDNTPISNTKKILAGLIKKYVPKSIKHRLWALKSKPKLDYNQIAFRVYIAIRMNQLLNEDADIIKHINDQQ